MPLIATRGAASVQGFGEFAQQTAVNYIEDVFSTYLYTGNGSTQTITNGIDLSTKGGLVWTKSRSNGFSHQLTDTVRGVTKALLTNATVGEQTETTGLTAFGTTGHTYGSDGNYNGSGFTYASWTFREQPKFFDIVTYTGNGSNRTIAHNLGSVPGCIIIKRTDAIEDWNVYHRSLANTQYMILSGTAAALTGTTRWNSTTPTDTVFSLGTSTIVNASGGTYIAYLFAHDAGGFGLTGTDNVISCGSFTATGSAQTVTLGYEPQWVLVKSSNNASGWYILDNMRGLPVSEQAQRLYANTSGAEGVSATLAPTATGFSFSNTSDFANAGYTYIYIAIRRGPMKVPTTGTSVFSPIARTGTGAVAQITGVGFPPDLAINADRTRSASANTQVTDRLRGTNVSVFTNRTDGDLTYTNAITAFGSDGETLGTDATQGAVNVSGSTYINWLFGRAPSFFDVVCYTGTGSARTVTHNLAAVPELIIVKSRDLAQGGAVYTASTGNANYLRLFSTSSDSGETATSFWNSTTPTASVFSLGTANNVNGNTNTYVAYLFATCANVSKVGSYAGTGSTQTINCGFTGGARFVLIKKSTSTAPDRDWYVWDTARGMVSGTDPSLKLNTTAAEVNANDVYTITTGFQIVSSSDYVNASGVTYIFLAIA